MKPKDKDDDRYVTVNRSRDLDHERDLRATYTKDDASRDTGGNQPGYDREVDDAWGDAASDGSDG